MKRTPFLALAIIAFVPTFSVAADKIDLDRITPVPADQPIPTQDFFRPRLLSQPELNPSGTHIAAVITAGEDKHLMLVYDIGTEKVETLGSDTQKDIYDVKWLNDSRVLFQVSSRKMYGLASWPPMSAN